MALVWPRRSMNLHRREAAPRRISQQTNLGDNEGSLILSSILPCLTTFHRTVLCARGNFYILSPTLFLLFCFGNLRKDSAINRTGAVSGLLLRAHLFRTGSLDSVSGSLKPERGEKKLELFRSSAIFL